MSTTHRSESASESTSLNRTQTAPQLQNFQQNSPLNSIDSNAPRSHHARSSQSSHISPWLVKLAYGLGHSVVLPLYFRKIEVYGQENLPTSGPVLLAPTHRSRWDALMLPYAAGRGRTGRDLRFMVTHDEVRGLQGWLIRRLGGFAVDTRRPAITSLRHSIELLERGEMIVIFPEGNIFRDQTVQPLKVGLARLAIQAATTAEATGQPLDIQIVPMSLAYSSALVPWRSSLKIHIGEPLSVQSFMTGNGKQDAKSLTQRLSQSLQQLLDRGFSKN